MPQILCILGGCNGAGKTTLARELLPWLGLRRFLNADAIALGLSPLDPTVSTFRAGRLLLEAADVRRRFERSRQHFSETYLPLADAWGVWDNHAPPPRQIADSETHNSEQLHAMLHSDSIQEVPKREMSEMSKIVLEAGRAATEKMLDLYKRMGIEVTPQMTLVRKEHALPARDNG
jgi:predicted ABC-type ATPase